MTDASDTPKILSDAAHPAWGDAGQIVLATYRDLRADPDAFPDAELVHEDELLSEATSWSAVDHHPLLPVTDVEGRRVRGTAFSALHRCYDFAHRGTPLDFHVQGAAVGLDSDGNYFLRASVGCAGERPDGELEVLAMFVGTMGLVGAIRWTGRLQDGDEHLIGSTGHDSRLAQGFDGVTQVHLRFSAEPHA